jgi:hypothetical protein
MAIADVEAIPKVKKPNKTLRINQLPVGHAL